MGISERRLGELAAAGIIDCILNDLGPEDERRRSPARGRVDEFGDRGGDRGEVRPLKLKCCWSDVGDTSDGAVPGDGGVVEADSLSRNSTHIFEKDSVSSPLSSALIDPLEMILLPTPAAPAPEATPALCRPALSRSLSSHDNRG